MTAPLHAHFTPDDQRILSATESTVTILACDYDHDADSGGRCLLKLNRDLYFAALTDWLDHKTSYCANGEFAGAGTVRLENLKLLPKEAHLSAYLVESPPDDLDLDTDEGMEFFSKTVPVKHYSSTARTKFEVQMEHA
jgi:hypothetical protein